ncbi:MAG TPA: hypothetical protein DCP69_04175 [Candidatus Omnitrophica bacterium]|nr:hypothetical protein [Candidatus Omnitrophota bacterium]
MEHKHVQFVVRVESKDHAFLKPSLDDLIEVCSPDCLTHLADKHVSWSQPEPTVSVECWRCALVNGCIKRDTRPCDDFTTDAAQTPTVTATPYVVADAQGILPDEMDLTYRGVTFECRRKPSPQGCCHD